MELTDEKRDEIIERYIRGEKTWIIREKCGVSTGDMYRVLHAAKVPLRSKDPSHPASSMAVRRQALTTGVPSQKPSGKLKVAAVKKLIHLSHEEVAYFKKLWEGRVREYGEESSWDAYVEVWSEYSDDMVARMEAWVTGLGDDARGIVLGLVAFKESLEAIKQLEPKFEERGNQSRA